MARSGARYTVVYGGATGLVAALTNHTVLEVLVVSAGLVLLLFVAGGTGIVRMGTIKTNFGSAGLLGTTTDPVEDDAFAEAISADLKLFFYAIGLVVFGFTALVAGRLV
ncbi:hypothetical protein [Halorussus lipolyticus]|uniref:hypothetical protein n=1 Tax=Halorussus lipolyticus TaxID=3034024 RepID=UPI0023E823A1|nr:hypothetical protein [Halorussus sp. DT80]